MSTEVKMVYADIEDQLSEMSSAAEALDPTKEEPINGNTMDVVEKLNELSTKLEQLLTRYQNVLRENIITTENSVEFMRETDENISAVMNSTAPGPKRLML